MPNEIIDFPTNEYAKKIAGMEEWKSLQAVRECLQYAIEKNMGRAPIIKFLSSNADRISIYKDEPRRFVEWITDNFVYVSDKNFNDAPVPPAGLHTHKNTDEAYELASNKTRALGREASERGSGHYGWFTAGWEVDSEIWSNIFGEHDPAITISEYADQMLNGPGPNG
jgi:hypothetical protein